MRVTIPEPLRPLFLCLSLSGGTPSTRPRRGQHPANGPAVPHRASVEWLVPGRESRQAENACQAPDANHHWARCALEVRRTSLIGASRPGRETWRDPIAPGNIRKTVLEFFLDTQVSRTWYYAARFVQ